MRYPHGCVLLPLPLILRLLNPLQPPIPKPVKWIVKNIAYWRYWRFVLFPFMSMRWIDFFFFSYWKFSPFTRNNKPLVYAWLLHFKNLLHRPCNFDDWDNRSCIRRVPLMSTRLGKFHLEGMQSIRITNETGRWDTPVIWRISTIQNPKFEDEELTVRYLRLRLINWPFSCFTLNNKSQSERMPEAPSSTFFVTFFCHWYTPEGAPNRASHKKGMNR